MAVLDPTRGREQAGVRPVLIFSDDTYNQGKAGLILAMPITSKRRALPHHVPLEPPEGGLKVPSSILCDGLRSLSKDRFLRRMGRVNASTLTHTGQVILDLLSLP